MKIILSNKTAELIEKKSRFIANVFYIENEVEANEKLNEIRKKYYDSKHNCFAYVIGKNAEIVKSSDDGEPSGTAGHPMLDILKGSELTNVIAIVTRYFGGVLLGTGGLVRAYSDSLKMALDNTEFSEIKSGFEVSFKLNYDEYGLWERQKGSITELSKEFSENIDLKYLIEESKFERVEKELINITKGRVVIDKKNQKKYYICYNNEVRYV